jgi:hypothetical protein
VEAQLPHTHSSGRSGEPRKEQSKTPQGRGQPPRVLGVSCRAAKRLLLISVPSYLRALTKTLSDAPPLAVD